jgi:putative redox protein
MRVRMGREEATKRFRHELPEPYRVDPDSEPELEAYRAVFAERLACSLVRSTLSKPLIFELA